MQDLRAATTLILGLLFLFLVPGSAPVSAQSADTQQSESQQEELERKRREKAQQLAPQVVSKAEERLGNWEKSRFPTNIFVNGFRGIRPVIGGMPSGSGFAGGVGYIRGLESEYVKAQANARYSTRGFYQFDGQLETPPGYVPSWGRAYVDVGLEDFPSLRFFGLGNDSSKDSRTFYEQEKLYFRAGLKAEIGDWVELSGNGGWMEVQTKPGDRQPSLDTVFEGVPGFGDDASQFGVYGGRAKFKFLDEWDYPKAGVTLSFEGTRYDDRTDSLYNTTKVVGELMTQIPLGYRNRRLAFRFRTAHLQADSGQEVPFYLMETIGGATTVRGYDENRFRDKRNLLMTLEYRWEVWTYTDFAFFADAGKAFSDWDDFDFTGLHTGFGWGIRVHAPGDFFFNIDLAGSKEGFKIHIGGGPRF